jgi:hypothetical protein
MAQETKAGNVEAANMPNLIWTTRKSAEFVARVSKTIITMSNRKKSLTYSADTKITTQ